MQHKLDLPSSVMGQGLADSTPPPPTHSSHPDTYVTNNQEEEDNVHLDQLTPRLVKTNAAGPICDTGPPSGLPSLLPTN